MPKFYVQSGRLEMVLQARDSRCAAIWAAHRTLGQTLPILCENESDYAVLSAISMALLGVSGWLGGELVYVHGIGVDTNAGAEESPQVGRREAPRSSFQERYRQPAARVA